MRIPFFVLIAGLAVSCGKIDKQEITSTPLPGSANAAASTYLPAMLVADTDALPACNAANNGQLVYVSSKSVFATCVNGTGWAQVNIGGGASSASSGISSAIYCSMTVSQADLVAAGLDQAPAGGVNFFYSVTQFANATRYVQARISSASYGYSSGIFWASKQQGYVTADSDAMAFDIAGVKDFGNFNFTMDSTVTGDTNNIYAVVYSDDALPSGKALIFNTATDCQSFQNN